MRKSILSFVLLVLISGCTTQDELLLNEGDYLIFGHFYGFCVGENCVENFKLTNKNLYRDSNHNYSQESFNFELLGNDKFEQVKDLTNYFPEKILSEKESTFGCPDCADGGGLYIEYYKNGTVKKWRIDQMKTNVPTYLHDFMDTVNEKIGLIINP